MLAMDIKRGKCILGRKCEKCIIKRLLLPGNVAEKKMRETKFQKENVRYV
jgi:hypothetical protein